MNILFEEAKIGNMSLQNRFVRSATWEGMATEEGMATPRLAQYLEKIARGGVGLILTSHAYVHKNGQASPRQLGIDKDSKIPELKLLTEAVHSAGVKICLQLSHAGLFSLPGLDGTLPAGPSQAETIIKTETRALSESDIAELVSAFGQAAARALAAGFDGVQIHAAHGYLHSQFLSPYFNYRNDAYGGDLKKRARFLLDCVKKIKAQTAPDYPLLVKMNCEDFEENGLSAAAGIETGQLLAAAGVDAIELSGGFLISLRSGPVRMRINAEEKEAYFRHQAAAFKQAVPLPVILVGGIRSYNVAEDLIAGGTADFLSLSRPLIRDADLIKRWQSGDREKSACRSDNRCLKAGLESDGIYCVHKAK